MSRLATIAVFISLLLVAVVLLITLINPQYLPETPTSTTVTADEDQPLELAAGMPVSTSPATQSSVPDPSGMRVDSSAVSAAGPDAQPLVSGAASVQPPADASAELQALPPVTGLHIAGYVMDEENQPIANSRIQAMLQSSSRYEQTAETSSDDKGYYLLNLRHPGEYLFYSTPPGEYLSSSAHLAISASDRDIVHNFIHSKADLYITGRVIDKETEQPVSGARVVITPHYDEVKPGQEPSGATTDAEGRFTVRKLAEGFFQIQVSAEGYVSYNPGGNIRSTDPLARIQLDEFTKDEEILIKLEKGNAARVRVYSPQGEPVPEADVSIYIQGQAPGLSPNELIYKKTDAQGQAVFDSIPSGKVIALAKKDSYGETLSELFEPGPQDNPSVIDVTLTEPATVTGRVTEKDGVPVADRDLYAMYQEIINRIGHPSGGLRVESAKTDADGNYKFEGLGAGEYQISVQGTGNYGGDAALKRVTLKAGEHQVVDFQLEDVEANEEIRGKVVNSADEPVPNLSVSATVQDPNMGMESNQTGRFSHANTNEQGEFHLQGLRKAEQVHISVNGQGYKSYNQSYPMDGSYLTITMESAGGISGIVLDKETREPVARAQVNVGGRRNMYGRNIFAVSRPDGTFQLENLQPGTATLSTSAAGYARSQPLQVNVKSGEITENVVIELEKGKEFLGLLLSPDNQPVGGASISYTLNPASSGFGGYGMGLMPPAAGAVTKSGADGIFKLTEVSSQGEEIFITHQDFAPTQFKITPDMLGRDPVPIMMSVGGSIIGLVLDENLQPAPSERITAIAIRQVFTTHNPQQLAITDANGEYRIEHLNPGTYMVMWEKQMGNRIQSNRKQTEVNEGETVRVDFGTSGGATIFGTVFQHGQPVPGATIMISSSALASMENFSQHEVADETGRYRIRGIPPGVYNIYYTANADEQSLHAMNSQGVAKVTVSEGQTELQVDLIIQSYEIRGIVRDAQTGEPVQGVQIRVSFNLQGSDAENIDISMLIAAATSNEQGEFILKPKMPHTYTLAANKAEYNSKTFEVTVPPAPDPNVPAQPVFTEVLMDKADSALYVTLLHNNAPLTSEQINFMSIINGAPQQIHSRIVDGRPGVYVISGFGPEPFDLFAATVLPTEAGTILMSFAKGVQIPKGMTTEATLKMYEIVQYVIELKTSDGVQPQGNFDIQIPDYPELANLSPISTIMQGRVMVPIPAGRHLVRLKVPGYRLLEFYPEDLAPADNPFMRQISVDLVKE
ncbi:MAG: carboxypeptidase regulatory-like domain-containing protein [bacterium]|jgi:uncharacterized GH25 family protein